MPAPALQAGMAGGRALPHLAGAVVLIVLLAGPLAGAALAAIASGATGLETVCTTPGLPGNSPAGPGQVTLTSRQAAIAATYIGVGDQLGVPREGLVVAVMMALQESVLQVLANPNVPESLAYPHDGLGSDHDSLGTAQQRPGTGWGTVEQLMDPAYNARAFYGGPHGPNQGEPPGLLDIPGWPSLDKGQAAQAVQRSRFPERYARWEASAEAIVTAFQGNGQPVACTDEQSVPEPPPGPGTVEPDGLRSVVLAAARRGVGGAYVWGGTAFKAWDCSGYVQWVYRQAGINLPRISQWAAGVPTGDPQPGDLVAQNPDGPGHWGHVGIYAGNAMMYSALNPAVGTLLHPVAWNAGTTYFRIPAVDPVPPNHP